MSSIEKLKIVGIRSFSPTSQNVIEFNAPLTIIVGHNGAGKTTIIECLKYATTGEMPPNSKGGAFVHDPKLSREGEVKAQIKLKFRNTRQQVMVVTRSLQLTQTKAKLTLKTLESLLSTIDPITGQQASISSRCAQLDSEMPIHLGVSKAVLQNVIFCHQEDSFWPLAESSVLKKKFDEIFAAEKYTKALDTLKSVRKQMLAEQKVEEERLINLKEKRDLGMKLEADIKTTEERIELSKAKISKLDQEIASTAKEIESIQQEMDNLASLQGEHERAQHELSMAKQSYEELTNTISIMNEPDHVLKAMLDQHESRSRNAKENMDRLFKAKQEFEGSQESLKLKQTDLMKSRGEVWAEVKLFERKGFDLDVVIDELCQKLSVAIVDDDVSATLHNLTAKVNSMKEAFSKLQMNHRDVDTRSMEAIQTLIGEGNMLTESRRTKRKAIDDNRMKIASFIDEIEGIQSSLEQIDQMKRQVAADEEALQKSRESFSQAEYQQRLAALTSKRKELEENIRLVNEELSMSGKFAEIRAKLELKRTEYQKKQDALDGYWDKIRYEVQEATGPLPSAENADKEIDRLFRTKERELKALQERHEKVKGTHATLQSKADHCKQTLEKKERELSEKKKRIESVCQGEDFSIALEETETKLTELMSTLHSSQSSKATYEGFIRILNQKHHCPLCERGFQDGSSQESDLSHKLSSFIANLPQSILDGEQQKRTLERRLNDLKGLRAVYDDVERLRLNEIPDLIHEMKTVEDERIKAANNLEDLSSELSNETVAVQRLALLKKKTEELSRLVKEAAAMKNELERAEQESSMDSFNSPSSPEELRTRSISLQDQLKGIQRDLEIATAEMQSKQNDLQSRERMYHGSKDRLMQIQLKATENVQLEKQKVDLEEATLVLEEEVKRIIERLEVINQQVEQMKLEREANREAAQRKELEQKAHLESVLQGFNNATSLFNEVEQFKAAGKSEILDGLEERLTKVEGEMKRLQSELASVESEISASSREEGELMMRERNLKDNIALRHLGKRGEELSERVQGLLRQLGGFDKKSTSEALGRCQMKHSELMGERSGLLGECRLLADQLFRMNQDLSHNYPSYNSAYKTQFIRVTASATAIDDLERYAKALDQAIMEYHGHKMDELNRLIKEFWTSTYQGADIDTIEIRAAHATEAGNRTYNYRVVMLKGDTELDMRGRSSAGQRVLACLIIRLALAETFGQSCGILALDEPTTNLDRDNIDALAASLADLIKSRREQANFQLIVITHDEEFVELMGRHECADYYYRVYKDESQYSTIEQQSFQGSSLS